MKILHISHSMKIGGAERALYQLIRGQLQRGLEPALLILSKGGYYAEKTAELDVQVYELNQSSGFDTSVKQRFCDIALQYDIVHFQTQSPLLMHAASKLGKPNLAYTHRAGRHRQSWKRRVMLWVTGRTLRRFQCLSGNTRHAARVAAHTFGVDEKRFGVTYNGLDFSLFAPDQSADQLWASLGGRPDGKYVIGTSANLRDLKRIDLLLKSVAKLDSRDRFLCLVIGDGPAKASLEEMSRTLGLQAQVQFLGRQENVANWLQLVDLFVLPSDDSESFGNSAVEAMGIGLPTVVMDDCGGMREHFPEDLRQFPVSVDDLAARIEFLSSHRTESQAFAEKCRDYVLNKYTIDNMVTGYQRLYEQGCD